MPAETRATTSPRRSFLRRCARHLRLSTDRSLAHARLSRCAVACTTLALLCALDACQVAPPKPVTPRAVEVKPLFTPVTFADLRGWSDDRVQDVWPAFRVSCKALVQRARAQAVWQGPCAVSEEIDESDAVAVRVFFERNFTPYRVSQSDGVADGLITGYFEPLLKGSRVAGSEFPTPLYAPPDDLLIVELADLYPELKGKRVRARLEGRRVLPYWTRAEIDSGKARTDGKVLVNVSDALDAFFLQIQGSGRVQLAEGGVMRVGYADQNGQPFRSVARVLIDRGELTLGEASMQGIREWGRRNPDKLPQLLDENPSYVFFREVAPPAPGTIEARIDGPIGALGVPLLAQRAIAIDPRVIPLGAPVFLATTEPLSSAPLRRLVMAQDTGGAIRGAIRADFFWGFGDEAGERAGRMRQQGAVWVLWPNGARLPEPS